MHVNIKGFMFSECLRVSAFECGGVVTVFEAMARAALTCTEGCAAAAAFNL